MFRALSSAATGMNAQETRVALIAHNLANVNTQGFKKSRAEFQDLLYDKVRAAGAQTSEQTQSPIGIEIGQGVKTAGTLRDFSQGDYRGTLNALDLAVDGNGLFQITLPSGETAYTRDGGFKLDSQGMIVTRDGNPLEPAIVLPLAAEFSVSPLGIVSVMPANSTDVVNAGQVQLANFVNPAGLEAKGGNLFMKTPASGEPVVGPPGTQGLGMIMSGYQEGSNVKVVEEMVEMIQAQRSYEGNSRVIKAADEMLRNAANIK